jgi:hypothetical protein
MAMKVPWFQLAKLADNRAISKIAGSDGCQKNATLE